MGAYESRNGKGIRMSDSAGYDQRIVEWARRDAAQEAIERAVKRIEGYTVKSESYRKALKLAARLVREALIVD
jgi:hypothetical protein